MTGSSKANFQNEIKCIGIFYLNWYMGIKCSPFTSHDIAPCHYPRSLLRKI